MFFLYFGKWNFLALRLKTFWCFLKKSFSYILGRKHFGLIFQEESFWDQKVKTPLWKNVLYFRKLKSFASDLSSISGNGTFYHQDWYISGNETFCNHSHLFEKLWGNSYIPFLLLILTRYFTCGKIKIW